MSNGAANSAKQLYDVVKNGPAAPLGLASILVLAGMLIGELRTDETAPLRKDIQRLERQIGLYEERIDLLELKISVHESESGGLKNELRLEINEQIQRHLDRNHKGRAQ